MSADHTIHSFRFDLTQLSQQNHNKVEDRVVRVFNQSFYTILNRVANRFAIEEELILDQLVLDLGGIPQEELEQQLPLRFERAIQDYFTVLEKKGLNQTKVKEEVKQHPLVYYLFNGVYPWYSPQQEPFKIAWVKSLERKSFVQQLFQYRWSQQAIKRLVQIGFLDVLEKTLKALVPDQEGFILNYHDELLEQHENKTLAHPASVDSLPTSANQEDHVSMAAFAGRRLADMGENTTGVLAVEYLAAAQGLDFRAPLKGSDKIEQAKALLRETVTFYDKDRYFAPDIAEAAAIIAEGELNHLIPQNLLPSFSE